LTVHSYYFLKFAAKIQNVMYILTFDVEEWFHILNHPATKYPAQWETFEPRIEANTERSLRIFGESDKKATFFILGWIAEKYPGIVKKILAAGHEIGLHSYAHQLIFEQTREEFREDLRRSAGVLGDISGVQPTLYRAPGFSITEDTLWALEILMEEGIKTDASVFPARRQHGGCSTLPGKEPYQIACGGMTLKEFPVNTVNVLGQKVVYSGGGYFRAWPYACIKQMSRKAPYVMTYFHPRDFDTRQPLVPGLPLHRRIVSYLGIKGAEAKLVKWLQAYDFINMSTAMNQIKWEQQPTIAIEPFFEERK
jgi:polysaccharide deacetylase family protein (PEP-CTERM system associated)